MIKFFLGAAVVLVYLLFLLTGDIQEDAYITFRTAFNLADHGELSFNLGENYNGATSFLYPRLVAIVRLIFGTHSIFFTQIINSLFLITASYLMSQSLAKIFKLNGKLKFYNTIALALLPAMVLMAARAVEMVYVVFLISLALHSLALCKEKSENKWLFFTCLSCFLLPFVRVDALLYSIALAIYSFPILKRKASSVFLCTIIGFLSYFLVLRITTGSWLPITMYAKSIEKEAIPLFDRLNSLWVFLRWDPVFLSPLNSKFFRPFCPIFFLVFLLISIKLLIRFYRNDLDKIISYLSFIYIVIIIPSAYAFMGVVFPWYFWPSHFILQSATFTFLHSLSSKNYQRYLLYSGFALLTTAQLILSFSNGYKENFRKNVGLHLKEISDENDIIFLEPAGYIPYFSELRTIDEVGLVSRKTIKYKKEFQKKWWINLVKKEKPKFLLQREHILEFITFQGQKLNDKEIKWFKQNYNLIKEFHYSPEKSNLPQILKKITSQGTMRSYYLFKLKDS